MIKQLLKAAKSIVLRLYALMILLVLVWAGYTAVTYLFGSVFKLTPVPEKFTEWQANFNVEALRGEDVPGVGKPAMRAPLGHYHGVDRWFQADAHNGCTVSGCHSPMPHSQLPAVRAFSNFHTTFLTCQTCHEPTETRPKPAVWVSMATGEVQEPPALLRLITHIQEDQDKIKNNPAAIHPVIVELLKQTLEIVGGDAPLNYLRVQIETSEPGSPVWRLAIGQLAVELPLHERGEYGAKIAPKAFGEDYLQFYGRIKRATRDYARAGGGGVEKMEPEVFQLYKDVHAPLRKDATSCMSCHGDKPSLLNLESLGYSSTRATALRSNPLADQMQQLRRGEPFKLPSFLGEGNAR